LKYQAAVIGSLMLLVDFDLLLVVTDRICESILR